MSSSTPSAIHHNVNPSEVGWQFVPQYYTFVNKQPDRLHCFYTKTSTFIHGTEGEDGKPCFGQQEIHNKITSINFQDCKVFIHSVDAQASANGGIIIQVIGEMSNDAQPWRKFVQTFFLAEQPNGYFVLNDIFRFLKEEAAESDDEAEVPAADAESEVEATPVAVEEEAPVPAQEPAREPSPAPRVPTPAPVVEEPAVQVEPEVAATPEPVAQTNGDVPAETAAPVAESSPEPAPRAVTPVPAATPAPAPVAAAPVAPTPAPAPVPKTWATLAKANSEKWGSKVAQESRGTTQVPTPAPAPSHTPSHAPPANRAPQQNNNNSNNNNNNNNNQRTEHPAVAAANAITHAQCFVKGVTEPVTQSALQNILTSRFGPIKEIEIVRNKACAFLEFTTVEAAKKAILACLSPSIGGEGGIRIDVGEGAPVRISVETKKERGERPPSRPRGGAPPNGEARGSFRGARGGPGGRGGRGTPIPAAK